MNKLHFLKKIVFLLAMMASLIANGENCLYIDDIKIPESSIGRTISVPIKAKFDTPVSIFEFEIILPEGLVLRKIKEGQDMYINYLRNDAGVCVEGDNFVVHDDFKQDTISGWFFRGYGDPHFIAMSGVVLDWLDTSTIHGVIRWEPGTYNEMVTLLLDVKSYFTKGEIEIRTKTTCSHDSRFDLMDRGSNIIGSTPGNFPYMLGDVDGTEHFDLGDVTTMVAYLMKDHVEPFYESVSDIVYNGQTDIVDIAALVDYFHWHFGCSFKDYTLNYDDDNYFSWDRWTHQHAMSYPFEDPIMDDYYTNGYIDNYKKYGLSFYLNDYRMTFANRKAAVELEKMIGDINGDQEVNITDINLLIDAIINDYTDYKYDLNRDGEITITDISDLIDLIFTLGQGPRTPAPSIAWSIGNDTVIVEAIGNGKVTLYKDGVVVDNPISIPRTSEDVKFIFTAIAQSQGEITSKVTTQEITIPSLKTRPEKTPKPIIAYTLTDDAMAFYAFGNGEVRLFANYSIYNEFGEYEWYDGPVENPFIVPRSGYENYYYFYATAQEDGKYLSGTTELGVLVPNKFEQDPEYPIDPHESGCWLVTQGKDGEEIWHEMVYDEIGTEYSYYSFKTLLDLRNITDSAYAGMSNVEVYFVIDGTRFGAPSDNQEMPCGEEESAVALCENNEFTFSVPVGGAYFVSVLSNYSGWQVYGIDVSPAINE